MSVNQMQAESLSEPGESEDDYSSSSSDTYSTYSYSAFSGVHFHKILSSHQRNGALLNSHMPFCEKYDCVLELEQGRINVTGPYVKSAVLERFILRQSLSMATVVSRIAMKTYHERKDQGLPVVGQPTPPCAIPTEPGITTTLLVCHRKVMADLLESASGPTYPTANPILVKMPLVLVRQESGREDKLLYPVTGFSAEFDAYFILHGQVASLDTVLPVIHVTFVKDWGTRTLQGRQFHLILFDIDVSNFAGGRHALGRLFQTALFTQSRPDFIFHAMQNLPTIDSNEVHDLLPVYYHNVGRFVPLEWWHFSESKLSDMIPFCATKLPRIEYAFVFTLYLSVHGLTSLPTTLISQILYCSMGVDGNFCRYVHMCWSLWQRVIANMVTVLTLQKYTCFEIWTMMRALSFEQCNQMYYKLLTK